MNMDEYRVSLLLSSMPQMIERLDGLLALAAESPEHAKTLAACTVILMAAVLDEGTQACLSNAAAIYAADLDVDPADTEFAIAQNHSLRRRMMEVPELCTDGKLRLDRSKPAVSRLHSLISVRNRLVHIREDAVVLDNTDPSVCFEGNELRIVVDPPSNPWDSVALEEALSMRAALKLYYDEVLSTFGQEIHPGEIVTE
jgi:hypothetical protein